MEVLNFLYKKSIKDSHEIKKAYIVIEIVDHGDEKIFLFRNLEKEGNGEEKGEDDDTTKH
jgi:hypothetical protein